MYSDNNNNLYNNYPQQNQNTNPAGPVNYSFHSPTPTPTPEPEKKEPKKDGKGKLVATMLAVALIAGAAGGGGTYLAMNNLNPSVSQTETETAKPQVQVAPVSSSDRTLTNVAEVVSMVSDSVVEVSTETKATNMFIGEYVTAGAGSGVILTEDGYIVTNDHVVEGATAITVRTSDGTEYEAKLIGTDSQTDLAVLKIEATGLNAVTLADSDSAVVGESAIVIGNPLGTLGGTVTDGIVSALDREITIGGQAMNLIQTSAAVNPGNSGGGLFNQEGQLLGVINAKSSGSDIEGLGFAIPANTVKTVVDSLIDNGYVAGRPELGIQAIEVNSEEAAYYYRVQDMGVYVAEVTRENGLESGDRIIKINDTEIEAFADIQTTLEGMSAGDVVTVQVQRGTKKLDVEVTLGEKLPDYMKDRISNSEKA
ncbi:MAG: S1C family serine protease [Oscillospiraceae bacterium]